MSVRGDVSSQFLTALLMALPLTGRQTTIAVEGELISKPYVEITLNTMRRFGVEVGRDGWAAFTIPAGAHYRSPGELWVEGDASSASYFLAAGAIGGGPVRVEGVGRASIQGDVRFAEALEQMGARIAMGENWIEASAPPGGKLRAIDADFNHIPDAAMTIAVAALFADGTCTLRNIGSWRVKETDRIAAMATELRKLGATRGGGRGLPARDAARCARARRRHRHLRRPPHGDVLFAGRAGRRDGAHQRSAVREQDLSRNISRCWRRSRAENSGHNYDSSGPVIAIDGPSASGKGTIAERVAKALGFHYLDSGALYRLVALAALQAGVELEDEAGTGRLGPQAQMSVLAMEKLLLNNRNVTDDIRSEICGMGASRVAVAAGVRQALLARQRAFRQAPGLVAEGRDMGTVVFPDARLKVFLTASAEVRAERRYKQLKEKGIDANIRTLLQELRERDERDSARSVAPLQKAVDALELDSTGLGIDEIVRQVLDWYRQRAADLTALAVRLCVNSTPSARAVNQVN